MADLTSLGKESSCDSDDLPILTPESDLSFGAEPLFGEALAVDHASAFNFDLDLQTNQTAMTQGTPVSQTISPQDLINDDWAPDSTPSSFLQTPGTATFDSPNTYIADSPFMDPLLDFGDENMTMQNHFHDLGDLEQLQRHHAGVVEAQPASVNMKQSEPTTVATVAMSRDNSSSSKHPSKTGSRVGKRKQARTGPLPAIVCDPKDTQAVKRGRNTLAARKSRAKRQQHVEELEEEVERLQNQVTFLRSAIENCADPAGFREFQQSYAPPAESDG